MLILSDIIDFIFLFVTVNKHAILTAFVMMCVCVRTKFHLSSFSLYG